MLPILARFDLIVKWGGLAGGRVLCYNLAGRTTHLESWLATSECVYRGRFPGLSARLRASLIDHGANFWART